MGFPAESIYVSGHIVASDIDDCQVRGEFLNALETIEPNERGFIENGRLVSLGDNPVFVDIIKQQLAHLHKMSETYLPDAELIKTVEKTTIDPIFAGLFRTACLKTGQAELPSSPIMSKLDALALGCSNYGALRISGLDVENAGPATALALANYIGEPYAEENETGEVVQTIKPKQEEAGLQTNGSFDVDLEIHVENVGQENVPDFIVLVCERNNEQAETIVLSPLKALWNMRKKGMYKEEALLWRSNFWVRTPVSFGPQVYESDHAVVSGYVELPNVQADFADVGANDTVTQEAYKHFGEACMEVAETVILQAGDALLFRNTGPSSDLPNALQVMHGRRHFTPSVAEPRILHRVYTKEKV
jgi:hypothetical protein